MTKVAVTEQYLEDIADAIRIKKSVSDTYYPSEMADAIMSISGSGSVNQKQINFIDYDGTILYSYTSAEWANVSELPPNPSHTGLTAQGWNWTKTQINTQLTAAPSGVIWVGQMYITESGDTEIDVSFVDSARLSPYLGYAINGTATVDWGDNSTSTITGSSTTTRLSTQHIYAAAGNYTITIHVESGTFAFYGTGTYYILHNNVSTANVNRVYANCVQAIRLGNKTLIGDYAFAYCCSLTSVTIPSSVTKIGIYAFTYCYSLTSVTIPSDVTSIGGNTFDYCYSFARFTIPSGVTSIGVSAFSNCRTLTSVTIPSGITSISSSTFGSCYSLANVTIPSGVTSIGASVFTSCHSLAGITISSSVTSISSSVFSNCYSLASVTVPSGVTSIGNSAFNSCYGMAEYHIKPTTPPTLGTTVFNNIRSDCKIYVPSASLSTYQSNTNWSAYASYMVGE